ncbi:unnamed protein product [Blepharisma stoltei]|uniref:DM10 domain-containing protein n=1 Tax=Blepharisma stoltei TaxID=1481888 RepID=A0AAU9JE28_9CILI|nr:unnamed protein product [Blepharisma stoltei]
MSSSIPFPSLPGFAPHHDPTKTQHKRVSAQKQEENKDYANRPLPSYPLPRRQSPEKPDQSRMVDTQWRSTTHSVHVPMNSEEITDQFEPTFVKMDRQVLRFFGYFKEPVVESAMEHFRVKKLILYYYLEDHTISVIEPREVNSGTPQGPFIKRQAILKADGSGMAIVPGDLRVGSNILVFGKNIRLVDCDQYTREFYDVNGIPQGPAEQIPDDPFGKRKGEKVVLVKDAAMKEFLEKSLGGGRQKPQKQFLDHDRKVLRFYCSSVEHFILHYYLADDTIEILEIHYPNDGKVEFPVFLRRNKLPKKFAIGQPGQQSEEDYLKEHEIEPSTTIEIYGRQFIIDSADEFTVNYYRQHYSRVFPIGPIPDPPEREVNNIVIPPHDGLGSEEDSLGYVYRLIPKPPYKDYFKFIDNSHRILRWTARFNSPQPEDVDRKFIISMFLNDDTLQIHEIPQRNSGIVEGKFLIRGKYKNENRNNEFFHPADFILGTDLTINRYRFHIESCDEHTQKWMEQYLGHY